MKRFALLTPLFLTLAVSACQNRNAVPLGADFGEAVHHNMSVQVINPDPAPADKGVPAFDGVRASGVAKRYETGNVTPPSPETTGGKSK
jgi:hypothetical protein